MERKHRNINVKKPQTNCNRLKGTLKWSKINTSSNTMRPRYMTIPRQWEQCIFSVYHLFKMLALPKAKYNLVFLK